MGGYYLNSAGVTTDGRVTSRFGTGRTALCAPPGGRDWKYGTIEEEGLFKAKSDECWARPRNAGIGDCVGHRLECMVFATVFVLHVTSSSSVH